MAEAAPVDDNAGLPSTAALAVVAELRRDFIATALDGAAWQMQAAHHAITRADDAGAEAALNRAADFARRARVELRALRAGAPVAAAA